MSNMFVPPGEDPRDPSPVRAGELETLLGFLRWQRQTLELKCSGVPASKLAARMVQPSTLSLIGLVRHLSDAERHWFRWVHAGEDAPKRYPDDADFDGAAEASVDQAWAVWREEIGYAERYVAEHPDLDAVAAREPVSLRWVLVHLIEEYARHNGHADLIRQRVDGRTGL